MKTTRLRYDRVVPRILKAMLILEGLMINHVTCEKHGLPAAVNEEIDGAHGGLGRALRRLKAAQARARARDRTRDR